MVKTRGGRVEPQPFYDMVMQLDPRHNPEFPHILPDYLRELTRAGQLHHIWRRHTRSLLAPNVFKARDYILKAKHALTVIRHRLNIWVRTTWLPHAYRPGGARYMAARRNFELLSQQRRATRRDTRENPYLSLQG